MSGSRDNYITPAESDCLAQIECERTTAKQEIENIQHILWLNFQDTAHYTAALCKDRGATNSNVLQFQFQQSAIAVTRLYKDSVDAVERAFELGQQYGKVAYRRDLSTWSKRKKRKINRLDFLKQLARKNCPTTPLTSDNESDDLSCVLSSLGVASPRSGPSSSLASPRNTYGEPSGLQSRQEGQNGRPNRELQMNRQSREGQNSRQQSPSPPSTPPHSSAPSYYVSRKRKAENLLDEFLETVHSSKRNRQ
ncbi:HUWE1-associated protein modifying stress responses-like [Bolinopsis microptera]|uniref:HUWE1-associated protein modifying stress responses-like n=1 Tax=Bolinopsis microptera TaxID=2820187 RepID=UPI00307905A5